MGDILSLLAGGFATAGTPINLMWAFVGCALGTAIGVLPGLGPAVTVAMLAAHHLAGGAHRVDDLLCRNLLRRHVRRVHHLDPAQHPGRNRHHGDGARGLQDGQERPCRRGPGHLGHRLFVAGTIATILVTLFAPIVAKYAVLLGPPEYFC